MNEELQARIEMQIQQLSNDNWWAAINGLVKIGEPAVPALIDALKDENNWVRSGATVALGEIGDGRAAGPLAMMLHDEEAWIRDNAAEALWKFGKDAIRQFMECAVKETDGDMRKLLVGACRKITEGSLSGVRIRTDEGIGVERIGVPRVGERRRVGVR